MGELAEEDEVYCECVELCIMNADWAGIRVTVIAVFEGDEYPLEVVTVWLLIPEYIVIEGKSCSYVIDLDITVVSVGESMRATHVYFDLLESFHLFLEVFSARLFLILIFFSDFFGLFICKDLELKRRPSKLILEEVL